MLAKKLIDYASSAGFDAVKFQKRNIDKVYTKNFGFQKRKSLGKYTKGSKKGLEFEKKEYDEINDYCKNKKILWTASAWDLDSQNFLNQYNLPFNKIASPMNTNYPLLEKVASEKKNFYFYRHVNNRRNR